MALAVVTCCGLVAGVGSAAGATPTTAGYRAATAAAAGGSWGTAQAVQGSAALNTGVNSVSCVSPGNCAAGGEGFVVGETDGIWGTAQGVGGIVLSVSCASAGNCAAGGGLGQAFVVDEVGGTWGTAQVVPGIAVLDTGLNDGVSSVSCVSAGNCTAGGYYKDSSGHQQAFVVDEVGGTWGTAQVVPGIAVLDTGGYAGVSSVSCVSAGNCTAGGWYSDSSRNYQAYVVDETGGTWGIAQVVPGSAALNTGGNAGVNSVSCVSAGFCAAAGWYSSSSAREVFVVDEVGGTWGTAQVVPGIAALNTGGSAGVSSVSCTSAGNCAAGGYYTDSFRHKQAFVVDEVGGTWGTAQVVPGSAALNTGGNAKVVSVSCPVAGYCTAGGSYIIESPFGLGAFVANEASATSTSISLSTPAVTYGDEQVEQVSAAVTSQYGTPGGTVTVRSGAATVCTITLAFGSGSCALPATVLPVSTAQLTASYNGSAEFITSTSAAATLTVSQAATTTALSLSPVTVTYGDEQAEHVSVTVSPQYGGTPVGTVAVMSGTATVCTITLASGTGTCTLAATQFPPGSIQFTAAYAGSTDFAGSISAAKTLTVAKATSKSTLSLSTAKVTYGREQSERLTVTVTPQYSGTPNGKVTVMSGTATVCTITLASGKGTCTLSATALPVGTHTLIAAYPGNSDFTRSTSAGKTLTVVR